MIKRMLARIVSILLLNIVFFTGTLAQASHAVNAYEAAEKIYIHFDKPYYSAGETIWYKAYLYGNGFPSLSSNELFLQLENEDGKIIETKRNPVIGATATGSWALDGSLPNGYYILKATTKTIAAIGTEFVYSKSICIYNSSGKSKDKASTKKISLQFFPESGHLIDRIKTNIAFKATDEQGLPIDVKGVVSSDSGSVITEFSSLHDGIGKLSFTPHLNELFFADVFFENVKYRFSLPKVEASGIYLKISDADTGKIFEVTRSRKDKELFDSVRLIVKIDKDTVYEDIIGFGNRQSLARLLQTKNISSGILHFILLSKFGVPLAERLSFVNNREYLSNLEIISIKRDSTKRSLNVVDIKFPDTIQRSFSISVTDAVVQKFPDKETIWSRLLLTADLKGYVYNPGFYFEKNDSLTNLALDNLMLTHGWTRYNWKKKENDVTSVKNESAHYLIMMSGTVTDMKSGKLVSNGNLNIQLIGEDSTIQSFDVSVGKDGKFKLDSLLYFGNARVYHTYTNANGKTMTVSLLLDHDQDQDVFYSPADKLINGEIVNTEMPAGFVPELLFESKFKKLDTVFFKTTARRPQDKINEKYASILYRTSGKLVLDNITNPYSDKTMSVVDYVLTNIRSIDIYRDEGILVNRKNFDLQTQRNWKVQVLLDEASTTVASVKSITMDKVALIKFFEAGFVGVGSDAPGGAVAIYLKKYDDGLPVTTEKKEEKYLSYKGYSVTQEFYKADYSAVVAAHAPPDNRVTLYWETVVQANAGSKKISFYNNDVSKKFSIVVEGFDANGHIFHIEKQEE